MIITDSPSHNALRLLEFCAALLSMLPRGPSKLTDCVGRSRPMITATTCKALSMLPTGVAPPGVIPLPTISTKGLSVSNSVGARSSAVMESSGPQSPRYQPEIH